MKTVTVDAEALRTILQALIGPPYYIREIQAASDIRGEECPITKLREQYNTAVAKQTLNTLDKG